jgi:regulator of protease activity HflC (stomatin/prohibitin superfamily)
LCAIFIVVFFIVPFSFHTVQAGQVAVVKHLGEIVDVKTPGTYYDFWMTNKYVKYDSTVQNVDIETAAYSSDAQTMTVAMTLQYQIISDHVGDIATQYGNLATLQNRIQSIATEKSKSVLSAYKAMDIIADRASMSPAVEVAIKEAIGDSYFVNVHTVVLTNIDFSDAFELAVEEKMIAEQAKLKAEYENEKKVAQAEAEAEAKLKAAQAEIDIAQAQAEAKLKDAEMKAKIAEAEALAKKAAAEGEAEALRIQSVAVAKMIGVQTIVDENGIEQVDLNAMNIEQISEYLKYMEYMDKWDGKLPTVMGNDSQIILPSDMIK